MKIDDKILVTSDGGRRASGRTAAACLVWVYRADLAPMLVAAFGRWASSGTSVDMEFEGASLGVQMCMLWLQAVA